MSGRDPSLFGDLLRRYRVSRGLTQEGLAHAARLSTRGISDLERGARRAPRRDTVLLLAEALELSGEERAAFEGAARRPAVLSDPVPATAGTRSGATGTLPIPPTPLIGREREVRRVFALLRRPDVRLVTLAGPGGVGKSRLGLRVGADLASDFRDGACYVDLSTIGDPGFVAAGIARGLGVAEIGGRSSVEGLAQHLRGKQLLLVLDNFEHLLEAAALVAQLLSAAPGLKVLVTSRVVLRLSAEHEYVVPPLALPDPRHPLESLETLKGYGAVALFVERAKGGRPDFELTSENGQAMVEVCHWLEGLPLAIELAAARVKLLSPQAMVQRLGSRLGLLTSGARDLPLRQRTMRDTIRWSYDLLEPAERMLLARISVFSGGRTLEAVREVCAAEGAAEDTLELLGTLVDNSLLQQREGAEGEPRFWMLETIREYAAERLRESGEAEELHRRHAEYYLALAEEAERGLVGRDELAWLRRLEAEHDNLRAALGWSLRRGESGSGEALELGLRLAGSLWLFWYTRGHLGEGREWLGRGLAASGTAMPGVRAKALDGAGWIAMFQGEYAAARALLERALSLYRGLGDADGIVTCIANLGMAAVLGQRDDIPASDLLEEAAALRPRLANPRTTANLLISSGLVAFSQGDIGRARELHEESLAISRAIGNTRSTTVCLVNLGLMAVGQADYGRAAALLREGLPLACGSDDKLSIQYALFGLAGIAAAKGQPTRAARLWGASEAVREATGIHLAAVARSGTNYDHYLEAVRTRLGEASFARTWAQGKATGQDRATAYALNGSETGSPPRPQELVPGQ